MPAADSVRQWRRGLLCGACAVALAALMTPAALVPEAQAVICANDPNPPNNGEPYASAADDGAAPSNTACGNGSDRQR